MLSYCRCTCILPQIIIGVPILACSRFLCLEESALGQFNCAKAQSIYRRPFGGRPRPLYRLRITTQQTSRVVGEPCNPLHSSNKDWRCLSVKPAELQRSYPHLDISPGGWVGKEQTRWARAQGAGVRVVPRVCHGASHPEGQAIRRLSVCPADWDKRCGWFSPQPPVFNPRGARAQARGPIPSTDRKGPLRSAGMQRAARFDWPWGPVLIWHS